METVVMIIMLLVYFNFILKLTWHRTVGMAVLSVLLLLFAGFTYEAASTQSKAQIDLWLSQPDLMLDTSVILTVDVAFQIFFCVMMAIKLDGVLNRRQEIMFQISYWIPGLLLFPVLYSMLVELIFAMPGTDFAVIGWGCGAAVMVLSPALALGLRWLLPEKDLRLELMFLVNLLTAALGIIATVNGRTAAAGTNKVEWDSLAGILAILLTGAVAGVFVNKYLTARKLNKLT